MKNAIGAGMLPLTMLALVTLARAQQPPAPCHPNRTADMDMATVGSVRVVLEPKPGLPTDPIDVRAFIDIFTDVAGLFVINNESGWYEGWMIHDLTVAPVNDTPRPDGHAQFGTLLQTDADALTA